MPENNKRPTSIDDAIRVLDQALQGNTAELKDLVSDELQTFKSELGELSEKFSLASISNNLGNFGNQAWTSGRSFAMSASNKVETGVRANPWLAIASVAAGTFAIGYLVGKSLQDDPFVRVEEEDLVKV